MESLVSKKPLLSIIISSFNDREIIIPYFEAIASTLKGQTQYAWELIYVDDGSMDGSVETLKELAHQHSEVTAFELSRNFGQQKAFFVGMKHAHGDIIITLDGDYQYEPDSLLKLADKIQEGSDFVSGIRNKRRDPFLAKLTSRIGQFFIRRALRYPIKDFGSIKAYSRFLIEQIVKNENYCIMPHGMAFALTNRITEISVPHRARFSGRSKWTFTKRLHMYFDLFLAYSPYEATSLIKIGSYLILLGFLVLSYLLYTSLIYEVSYFHSFKAVTALCLIAGGFSLIFSSLFLSFLLRIYRQLLWNGQCYVQRKIHHQASPVVDLPLLKSNE